ncbi:two-component sensor histidine kinase [Brevibacterium sp. 5221]|uniref:histidine kinase n=1 Tax=Brevibacterium rongguiense TaxID=2695267 RepID=A0A6N9H6H5_9MICO|nr:HAMP domain-containing sensor histidine kinase [Brevibacterium rongguiense]MYM19356.1 two-component sensor histidine kinase [Brevibacterium rongguiense]
MSLRWKIVIVIVASVVIAVLSCGFIVRHSAASAEDNRMRENVTDQLSDATTIYAETGVLTLNTSVDDSALPAEARSAALKGQSVTIRSQVDGKNVIWAAGPIQVGSHAAVISVRASTEESAELLERIDRAILYGMIGSAVVIGGIGSLVAGQISRRLTLGAQTARRIAAGDTSEKISDVVAAGDDEVSAFAEAVDSAVARLAERLDSEQRFTADLAHEMRTPLTGLVNAANLLEEDSRPAELVRDRVHRLQVLVEDLLEVSRLDAGRAEPVMGPVTVVSAVKSLLTTLRASGALGEHVVIEDYRAPDAVIVTDQRRFERIVSNLITNAVRHGADPISIVVDNGAVMVSDAGAGYPADIIDAGPTRFVSAGGGGMGLGLVIAQGQAKLLGMRLVFRNGANGGAQARVEFPSPADQASAAAEARPASAAPADTVPGPHGARH